MEFTKGPWKPCMADGDGCSCHMIWSMPCDCVVAVAIGAKDENYTEGEGIVDEAVIRANAQLISASPDLYEALKELLNITWRLPGCGKSDCLICKENKQIIKLAQQALAKVEGK